MTSLIKFASVTTVAALMFAGVAAILPTTANALNAPRCVLNTIVQPFNNGGTTLSWKVYDAHTVEISGIGTVSDADSIVVYPSETKTYTLTATGNGGVDTCTAVVQPTSSYSFNNYNYAVVDERCEMWVNPDYVVPGGTGILSWSVNNANRITIDHGIGTVGNSGTRVIPNTGVPQTFTLTAEWSNGVTRTCSATMRPTGAVAPTFSGGVHIPGAFVAQTPGVILPNAGVPQVTATYTQPTPAYVSINQVPYTGTDDVAYVLTLLAVALGAFTLLYAKRDSFRSVLASFSPVDNDDFEVAVEQAVIHEA